MNTEKLIPNCKIENRKTGKIVDAYENNQSDIIYHLNGDPIDQTEWVIYCSPEEVKAMFITIGAILLIGFIGVAYCLLKVKHII